MKVTTQTIESEELHKNLDRIANNIDTDSKLTDVNTEVDFGYGMEKLFDKCEIENYFWQYCSFNVYKNVLNDRYKQHLVQTPGLTFYDFLNDEDEEISGFMQTVINDYNGEKSLTGYSLFYHVQRRGYPLKMIQLEGLLPYSFYQKLVESEEQKMEYIHKECTKLEGIFSKNPGNFQKFSDNVPEAPSIEEMNEEAENIKNNFSDYFKNDGLNVFIYLDEVYTRSDKYSKAKYSNLYHFLDDKELLLCSKKEYIDFVRAYKSVKLSKILEMNFKFENTIRPHLNDKMLSYEKD